MIVSELITDKIPSIKSSDMAGKALDWMNEFKVSLLPVVDEAVYKGLIQEENILDASSLDIPISEVQFLGWDGAYVYQDQHIYEAIRVMSRYHLELLPVLDEDNTYLGLINLKDLFLHLDALFAIHEPGGIIVLDIPPKGYLPSEIARIVESNDAKILSLYISQTKNDGGYYVTLKLNIEDLSRVIASFERFEYTIHKTYYHTRPSTDFQRNLDALMNYLDI